MYELYFENSRGERRLIGLPLTKKESWKTIHEFCEDHNFYVPYVRSWVTEEGETYYDVSSHTEFFVEVEVKG